MRFGSLTERTGLVLAAGYGSRHSPGVEGTLKPLLSVSGRALILRTFDSLEVAGCSRIVVVLGYAEDRIREYIEESYTGLVRIVFVHNPRFDLHNGVSVLAARDALPDEFVLAMADHVFEDSIPELIGAHRRMPDGATLVVDWKLDSILDIDDATKVVVENGKVVRIGKELTDYNAVDCGLFLAGSSLVEALDEVFRANGNASLSDGVQKLAAAGLMEALDLGAAVWQDVDTAETLLAAERILQRSATSTSRRRA